MRAYCTIVVSGILLSAAVAGGGVGNSDFASRLSLPRGVQTVDDELWAVESGPDTVLGSFNQFGGLIEVDDDSSDLGDGSASGLYFQPVNSDGSIHLSVSGFADMDFDGMDDDVGGAHVESGPFDLWVDVYDRNGDPADILVIGDTLAPGLVIDFDLSGYDPLGDYDAYINNLREGNFVDFVSFTSLPAGRSFQAAVSSEWLDGRLGWFNDAGAVIQQDDRDDDGLLLMAGEVPPSGQVNMAVAGWDDFDFEGFNDWDLGSYSLFLAIELLGDCNNDGFVGQGDLDLVLANWGTSVPPGHPADRNGDEFVGQGDLDRVLNDWGLNNPPVTPVPEPTAAMLLGVGWAAWIRSRRRPSV